MRRWLWVTVAVVVGAAGGWAVRQASRSELGTVVSTEPDLVLRAYFDDGLPYGGPLVSELDGGCAARRAPSLSPGTTVWSCGRRGCGARSPSYRPG